MLADETILGNLCDILVCPICQYDHTHIGTPKVVDSQDNYKAWVGRGDKIVLPVESECGSEFQICFGYHKGQNFIYTEILKKCEEDM